MRVLVVTFAVVGVLLAVVGLWMFSDIGGDIPVAPPPPTGPKPVAKLQGRPAYHFGQMYATQKGEHTFTIHNDGDAPLQLYKGETSCGCTGMEVTTEPIPPGKTGTATVRWVTKPRETFNEMASVSTNDPIHPKFEFAITGQVIIAFTVSTPAIDFGRVPKSENAIRSVELVAPKFKDLAIRKIELANNRVETKVEPLGASELKERGAAAGFRVFVTLPPGSPSGALEDTLKITTNHPGRDYVEVDVVAVVVGEVSSQPDRLDFAYVYPEKDRSEEVFIYGPAGSDLSVRVDSVTPTFLKAELIPQPGKAAAYVLKVTVPAKSPPGQLEGKIVLKTNNQDTPQLPISVSGLILNPK